MCEVLQLEHLLGMLSGRGQEAIVPLQPRKTHGGALVVHEIEHLPFGDRIGRELEVARKVEILPLVLAELRDEERNGLAELPGKLRKDRLEGTDLIDEPARDA